ncbi:RNA-binding CRS1 / YhbY (CRM) domain protein [Striga hermonthica]|uniref:RNA-binding CRS1 / YhbY (CRM) domain protein n=1 Tax=Striga hermonthica TaxID=68872 RepID=A0A9N7MIY0_STRHE|nr:RNA-binding CRS1 / YhbY (CRM) domain protein [Striga hermonthica]
MATLVGLSSPHLLLHRFILRRPTLPLASLAHRPFPHFKTTPFYSSFRFSTSSPSTLCSLSQLANDVVLQPENVNTKSGRGPRGSDASESPGTLKIVVNETPPPSLTVKEKKDLASYAHSLGKKLKSQQVGKSGVTDTVVTALVDTLEANELLKLKIHGSCPGDLEDVVKQLEKTTGSVVVGQIGRTVILYRPSLTKQKAEEKKKQAQRIYLKRQSKLERLAQVGFLDKPFFDFFLVECGICSFRFMPRYCGGFSIISCFDGSLEL